MAEPPLLESEAIEVFSEDARRAVYECMALRRDVRHFRHDAEIDPDALERILGAAHLAPSVGFSQPWGFVLLRDRELRARIRESFLQCRAAEAVRFPAARRDAYLAHKLEGILEAPLNLCVAVDLRDRGEAILGTTSQPEAVRASACCAVENLWLAARAEGIGVGWVSIVEPAVLRRELMLPAGVEPMAYLCMGRPIAFRHRPMLEETGWQVRRPVSEVVHARGRWEERVAPPAKDVPSAVASLRGATLSIRPASDRARETAREHLARLTKPVGSLGRLEELAVFYAGARGIFPFAAIERAVLALFAADHGVVENGVSAYGSPLTAAMVGNVMSGGAAIHAIAREARAEIVLTDVGVAGDLSALPTKPLVALSRRQVRPGTGDMLREAAMERHEVELAMEAGAEVARDAARAGAGVIGVGEIGIGNTTSAAALTALLTGRDPKEVVGKGTGIGAQTLAHKISVVRSALERHRPVSTDPIGALAVLGGLEIAALAGCMLEAARQRLPVVLDGFVTNAAALVAARLDPRVTDYLLAAHASPEPGARAALEHLSLVPLFDLGMRLGEGTGAALGISLLRTAVSTALSMATFATAGIVGRAGVTP